MHVAREHQAQAITAVIASRPYCQPALHSASTDSLFIRGIRATALVESTDEYFSERSAA
jgi:hypothetical protein